MVPLARKTDRRNGLVAGQPVRYLAGHHRRASVAPPEGYRVDPRTGCWVWMLEVKRDGYGAAKQAGRKVQAHRAVYERLVGPIPTGLVLDHIQGLCDNRACVKVLADAFGPAHLEPVTPTENNRRSRATKLSVEKVAHIRASTAPNHVLAKEYGVDPSNISHIRARRSWPEVAPA